MTRNNSIYIEGLAIGYPSVELFRDVSLEIRQGEVTALIGRNGTGKSSLLRTIAGILKPISGKIVIQGENIRHHNVKQLAQMISFVSTDEVNMSNLSVYDLVGMGRSPYTNWLGSLSEEDKRVVAESLKLVGMSHFAEKKMDELSDGERQRVMIARSLAQDTPIILLDEPTAFLDLPNRYEICLLLSRLAHEKGKTILFSTHDLNIALEICDRVIMIRERELICDTPETMISRGEIGRFFEGTSLTFDQARSQIVARNEKKW